MAECKCVGVPTGVAVFRKWCPVHAPGDHTFDPYCECTACGKTRLYLHRKHVGDVPEDPRLAEMRAILQALEKAWSKTPEWHLGTVLHIAQGGVVLDNAELLKALEKYGVPK